MGYQVTVVEDQDLPVGTDWVMVRAGDDSVLIIKRCRATPDTGLCEVLTAAWTAAAAFGGGQAFPAAVA